MEQWIEITTQEEIRKKAKDRLWDIKAVYALDSGKIEQKLKEEAEQALPISVIGHDKAKAKKYIDNATAKYRTFSDKLEKLYSDSGDHMKANPKLMKDAADGTLEHKAPAVSTIWFFWFLILLMAGGLELAFFTYMVFFKDAGGAIIGLAVLLLIGGLFAGHGFAAIMAHGIEAEYKASSSKIKKKDIILLIIGIVLIAIVTGLRWVFGGFLAGIVAFLFGMAVTTSETFFGYSKAARKFYLKLMFLAQQHYAAIEIDKDLGEKGNEIDDSWRKHYEQFISDIIINLRDTTSSIETGSTIPAQAAN